MSLITIVLLSIPKPPETPVGGKATVRLRSAIARGGSPAAHGKRGWLWDADIGYRKLIAIFISS